MSDNAEARVIAEAELEKQDKVVSLFQFIRELNKLKQKAILNLKDYLWCYELSNLPDDPDNISVFWPDRVEDDGTDSSNGNELVLLSVHKPEFQRCPEPDDAFKNWLELGWEDYRAQPSVLETVTDEQDKASTFEQLFEAVRKQKLENGETTDPIVIHFNDDEGRVASYENWLKARSEWVEKQKITVKTRDLFADLYRLYFELQRESETEEMIAANGVLCDRDNPAIKHPVLTHRVKIDYDADKNTVFVLDTDVPSEMYSVVFQMMEDVNLGGINTLNEDLQNNDYHPLDRNDTPGFLNALVNQLSSDSKFSDSGIPVDWSSDSRLLLYLDPCLIVRKRLDGTLKAIEQIIENVQETGEIPAPIVDIVSGGKIDIPEDVGEKSVEEQLAAVGGESVDILLSKEANKEQLEIARRIENYNAVLVQGPPGTGKTHTIANLMGHFLAQGKSVLVTSHTPKALSVLKEKLSLELQGLCVSVLDDTNVDMERSVDAITSYMSKTTSFELAREMEKLASERKDIINKLAKVRRKIFNTINQECSSIVYNGEEISPSEAAKFVLDHTEDLSYIPGKVRVHSPLPLTFEQLKDLYRSNEGVTAEDEAELAMELPNPEQIIPPSDFADLQNNLRSAQHRLETIAADNNLQIHREKDERKIAITGDFGTFAMPYPAENDVRDLKEYADSFGQIEEWQKYAAVDGKIGGSYRNRWISLIDRIRKANEYAESIVTEQVGIDVQFANPDQKDELKGVYEHLRAEFDKKGKIGKFALMAHKEYGTALEAVTINGRQPSTAQDCDIVLHCIELEEIRKQCATYWDELLSTHGVPKFFDLDHDHPERIAANYIPQIEEFLNWYQDAYQPLLDKLDAVGIPADTIFEENPLDSEIVATDKILSAVESTIPAICELLIETLKIEKYSDTISGIKPVLMSGERGGSNVCTAIVSAINNGDTKAYTEAYSELASMYSKYALQNSRMEMLKELESIAPQWADAIRNRDGIHGQVTVPDDIEDAWKWKQLSGIVEEINADSLGELQAESTRLSKEYRQVTAQYAEKCAWYHLLKRTESDVDMRQALQGWKQTVKKIGKGTGKKAPALKAKARELMAKCQNAVPGWIMPINRALESLNPKDNQFDIIIIDEASQSDISSLAILYMGKKLIIVGDDKQVSPMAVGMEVDKMNALEQMYIKDKIPNSHLYNAQTSIYDIAATTFQPLMLREHFRCVPEIIGFSNKLSYDNRIKPLRDASNSTLLPAVVSYRVANGKRGDHTKTNQEEAKAIVALIQACIEQPEYAGKSFGVISLLGDEQAKLIQQLIVEKIDSKEIQKRKILCGNSAHFQGDERDVIFLSVVDSGNGAGPVNMMSFGPDDTYRKRYNVAASRARDQLWVVHSFNPSIDLKPGDIRKTLIDYAANPNATEILHREVEEQAESPFEEAVAKALVDRGYHIVQQWKVGAYRLDIVVVCGKKTVAIECDGERYHSGEAKIREDMERQAILERLGWRFIRIRGSEYYRNPDKTMERVIAELTEYGIEPEASGTVTPESRNTELLSRVKNRAASILYDENGGEVFEPPEDTITAALSGTNGNIGTNILDTSSTSTITISGGEESESGVPLSEQSERGTGKSDIKEPERTITSPISVEKGNLPEKDNTAPSDSSGGHSGDGQSNITKGNDPVRTQKPQKESKPVAGKQHILAGTNTPQTEEEDIISLLKKNKVEFIDKRKSGGALWIIGGSELKPVVGEAKKLGFDFTFKKGGGKLAKNRDAWWAKEKKTQ